MVFVGEWNPRVPSRHPSLSPFASLGVVSFVASVVRSGRWPSNVVVGTLPRFTPCGAKNESFPIGNLMGLDPLYERKITDRELFA